MDPSPFDGDHPLMTPIRTKLLDMVEERLAEAFPDVPVERARRALVEDHEMPRLILRGGDLPSSDGEGFGETTYAVGFVVEGYDKAAPDSEEPDRDCERALSQLHADVVKALVGWQPDGMDLNEVREGGQADFNAYDLDDSATAAGEFVASFEAVSIRPTGHPYAA